MGTAPPEEGSGRQGGRLARFMPGRRPHEAPEDESARTVATAPPHEAPTVVGGSGEREPEPPTRVSAAGPAATGGDDATTVHEGRGATGAGPPTAVHHPVARDAGDGAPSPAADGVDRMRVPGFSPLAPVAGWLTAWGLAALAAQCFQESGVGLGQGLGIASADGAPDGLWNGIWLLVVNAGAWLFAGYVAARMARGHGTRHAALAWALAMLATAADALTGVVRDGYTSVLAAIDIPSWIDTGLGEGARTAAVYGIFALAALAAALIGGGIGQGANALARRRTPA